MSRSSSPSFPMSMARWRTPASFSSSWGCAKVMASGQVGVASPVGQKTAENFGNHWKKCREIGIRSAHILTGWDLQNFYLLRFLFHYAALVHILNSHFSLFVSPKKKICKHLIFGILGTWFKSIWQLMTKKNLQMTKKIDKALGPSKNLVRNGFFFNVENISQQNSQEKKLRNIQKLAIFTKFAKTGKCLQIFANFANSARKKAKKKFTCVPCEQFKH